MALLEVEDLSIAIQDPQAPAERIHVEPYGPWLPEGWVRTPPRHVHIEPWSLCV